MKVRELWKSDLKIVQLMLFEQGIKTSLEQLETMYDNSFMVKAIEDVGLEGFIMIRKLGFMNELTHWHLNPEHSLILKGLTKQIKNIGTYEHPSAKERIKILEENGFKKIAEAEGLLKNSKAIILRRDSC